MVSAMKPNSGFCWGLEGICNYFLRFILKDFEFSHLHGRCLLDSAVEICLT